MQHIGRGVSPPGSDPNATPEERALPLRAYINGTIFLFFNGGLYFVWLLLGCINSKFYHGYPQLASDLPGPYLSALFGWDWVATYLLAFNGLVYFAYAMALTHNKLPEWVTVHRFCALWALALNVAVFVILTVLWWGFYNNGTSGWATSGNSYLWCCFYWGDSWCPNNAPCAFTVTLGMLTRNQEATINWAFSLVFFLLAWWNLTFVGWLKRVGVLIDKYR